MNYGDIKIQLAKNYYSVSDNTPLEQLEEHIEQRIKRTSARSGKMAQASLKLLKIDLNTIKQIKGKL